MIQEFLKGKKRLFIIIGSVFLLLGGVWFYIQESNDKILMTEKPEIEDGENRYEGEPIEETNGLSEEESTTIETQPREMVVHIVGQVKNPGVVLLEEGARLMEAVEKLGGATQEANLEAVNLAKKLVDEEKVYIPKIGEEVPQESISISTQPATQEKKDGKININTCNQEQLKELPGIGEVISKHIIEYREAQGGFQNIVEIKEVNRIGDKIFNDIKDKIRV